MTPTPEQGRILNLLTSTSSNLSIRALAGTGKTSTLELIEGALDGAILCLAFNKRIADEMAKRFKTTSTVRTFNSLGHRIWAKACSKGVVLNPKKTQDLLRDHIRGQKKADQSEAWEVYWEVIHAVGLAKSLGYVPSTCFPQAKRLITEEAFHEALEERPSPLACELIDEVLCQSISAAYNGQIDFNDQIYMPALFGGTFPRFPLVLVDEAQDLSPTNHAMLAKFAKNRIIIVGDPWQSIYGFRGAQQGGMAILEDKFAMIKCDLSVSFRCPQHIVENVHWRVPHFKWNKPGGRVEHLTRLEACDICDGGAIICRNNAPCFRLAFELLARGRSVSVAGSDIGPKVIGVMSKLGSDDTEQAHVLYKIEAWREDKLEKGSSVADDMADCMRIFATHGETLGQAIAYANHLFAQQGTIRLLTGHKAKGLEWDTVYHLDPWRIGDAEQELNLRYVISTRAKRELFEVNSKDIRWS
jgi:superfamily I DNA/RNA helicase